MSNFAQLIGERMKLFPGVNEASISTYLGLLPEKESTNAIKFLKEMVNFLNKQQS